MNSPARRLFAIVYLLVLSTSAKAASERGADPVVGKWSWGGPLVVEFWQNGRVRSYPPLPVDGQWNLVSRGGASRERKYTISWNGGQFIDTLSMSMDRQHLYGQNQVGWRISAIRMSGGEKTGAGNAETTAEATPARRGVVIAKLKPIEGPGEEIGEVPVSTPPETESATNSHGTPTSATVVVPPGDPYFELGDIKVTFSDGHSETWAKGGICGAPHVSPAGDVGWSRAHKRTTDRYGRDSDVLHLHLHDGTVKEFKPNNLFIMDWGFASQNTEVIIKSMAHHGSSCYIKYDLKTGAVTGHVDGYLEDEKMPKWTKPFLDQ